MSGISKVGEGIGQPDQNIPIDIHANKLLEWLVDRKRVSANWKKGLPKIKSMISAAVADLPPVGKITALAANEHKHYFLCQKIFEQIRDNLPEAERKKTFFGSYSDKRLKEWDEIIRAYEKDYVYLGDSAQILGDAISYDLPSLKKEMEKCANLSMELEYKEKDYTKSLPGRQSQLQQQYKSLGIKGDDIRLELLQLTAEIPSIYSEAAKLAQKEEINSAFEFYIQFSAFMRNKSSRAQKFSSNKKGEEDSFAVFKYIVKHGNELIGQMKARQSGKSEAEIAAMANNTNKDNDKDDSNSDDNSNAVSASIDWSAMDLDATASDSTADAGTINWEEGAPPAEISWDDDDDFTMINDESAVAIEVVEISSVSSPQISLSDSSKGSEKQSNRDGDDKKQDLTQNILSDATLRSQFTGSLLELECFLKVRKLELETKDDTSGVGGGIFNLDQLSDVPAIIQQYTLADAKKQLVAISAVLALLDSKKLQMLLEIKSSPRYVDRLVASLQQQQEHIEKLARGITNFAAQREECSKASKLAYSQYEQALAQARSLKSSIEAAISRLYNDRQVTIRSQLL